MINKLDTLKKFETSSKLPKALYIRIKRHIENTKEQKKFTDSGKFLNEIPPFMRDAVVAKTHSQVF